MIEVKKKRKNLGKLALVFSSKRRSINLTSHKVQLMKHINFYTVESSFSDVLPNLYETLDQTKNTLRYVSLSNQ